MRLLLDTHSLLWFLLDDSRLSSLARDLIIDPRNVIEVSPASYREIAIKISLGKYSLPEPYGVFMEREIVRHQFRILHIEPRYSSVNTLKKIKSQAYD